MMRRNKIIKERRSQMPFLYKEAGRLLEIVEKGESLHNAIYKIKHGNIKGMYSLVCKASHNKSLLNEIFIKSGLAEKDIDQNVARILASELLWGKKNISVKNKTTKIVESYLPKLKEAIKKSLISETVRKVSKPRYARINTLLTSVEEAIKRLKGLGWSFETTPESYEKFKERIVGLGEREFLVDYHFDDLLVFNCKGNLFCTEMVENGLLLLQDKASCLAPVLLNPPPGSSVLDMCAAPGIKTLHLASLMKNQGCLYSVDMNGDRFKTLLHAIEKKCPYENCVRPLRRDSVSLTADDCPGVKYILVDPSCSGGGMTNRIEDLDNMVLPESRLKKLASFQVKILTHALTAFPDVERVVYSTCSESEQENEQVIRDVLANVPEFEVVSPNIKWERKGSPQYEFGSNCLVTSRKEDLTNGFFVAVLERVGKNAPDRHLDTTRKTKKRPKKRKSNVVESSGSSEIVKGVESETNKISKKRRKSKVKKSKSKVKYETK